jgi:integrase
MRVSGGNDKHKYQWRATLQTYAFPVIGDLAATAITAAHVVAVLRPIWAFPVIGDLAATAITAAHVVAVLRPIWTKKAETARRVRQRIEAILDYAADPDDANYRNPAAFTPQLEKALPKLGKGHRPSRHPSLPYDEAPAFLSALRASGNGTARQEAEAKKKAQQKFPLLKARREKTGKTLLGTE